MASMIPSWLQKALEDKMKERKINPSSAAIPVKNGVESIIESQNQPAQIARPGDFVDEQTEAPQKKGLFGGLKSFFKSSPEEQAATASDSAGINPPERTKLFDKKHALGSILSMAAPAIWGATQGVGILPGLMAGAGSLGDANEEAYKTDVNAYGDAQTAQA